MILSRKRVQHYVTYVGFFFTVYLTLWLISTRVQLEKYETEYNEMTEMVDTASWDYVNSILESSYLTEARENSAVASLIRSSFVSEYGDVYALKRDLSELECGNPSRFSGIISGITRHFENKLIMYVRGDQLFIVDEDHEDGKIKINTPIGVEGHITDIIDNILNSDILETNDPNNIILYTPYGMNFSNAEIKTSFINCNYDLGTMKDVTLYYPSFINWETGIFGERVMIDGVRNPNAVQLVIVSKSSILDIISMNPSMPVILENHTSSNDYLSNLYRSIVKFDTVRIIAHSLVIFLVIGGLLVWYDMIVLYYRISDRRSIDRRGKGK